VRHHRDGSSWPEVELVSGAAIEATVILHPGDNVTAGVKLAIRR
jgi:hypothetical protein